MRVVIQENYDKMCKWAAEYIAAHMPEKVIATIYDSSDTYSSGIEATFEAKAAELGLLDRTVFVGKLPYEETAEYLRLSEVAAAPKISLSEGDGKLYNYMATGMAAVCFERSISREILGDAGLYAPMGDAAKFGEQLARLMLDPQERKALGEKARKRAEGFSIHENAKKIDAFYKELMHAEEAH